jgi:hypothetical protein
MEENNTQLMPICNFKVNPLVADNTAELTINNNSAEPQVS